MSRIDGIWHNAFLMLMGENAAATEDLLAQSARMLSQSSDEAWSEPASAYSELAYSFSEAIKVSRRVAAAQPATPLNPNFGGHLILVREQAKPEATLGGQTIRIVGLIAEDVENLKVKWNSWLRDNRATVATLRDKVRDDAAKIGLSTEALVPSLNIILKELGNRDAVTAPNLVSLMLLVEEQRKRVLLTGDGHSDDIIAGLEHRGQLTDGLALQIDVRKFQHHGSEHSINEASCRRVLADHYVFCGNGTHENPDVDAVKLLIRPNEQARPGSPYKLWFNCSDWCQITLKAVAAEWTSSFGAVQCRAGDPTSLSLAPLVV